MPGPGPHPPRTAASAALFSRHGCVTYEASPPPNLARPLLRVDFVRLVFGDPHGLARSKTLTADAFRSVLRNGMNFSPGPFLFDTGHAVAVDFLGDHGIGVDEIAGAGNFVLVPDPVTFSAAPNGPHRRVSRTRLRDGTPHPLSSRAVLRRVVNRYAALGLQPVLGLEVEWYLTRRLDDEPGNQGNGFGLQGQAPRGDRGSTRTRFNLDPPTHVASDLPPSDSTCESSACRCARWNTSRPGQVETTFSPMTALDTADAMLLFRTVTKRFCARRGHHAPPCPSRGSTPPTPAAGT
ncbi:hypothetical protein [Streptomyces sp. DHE17-7]|uniref:hypothetical protein n=1 Tax=Streptomyces sp. DHE17-7 TaxID=2759949 RepID=UPI0022EA206B|nr:hypothetical protein [Streptomyces sp. DHE17-7]MBJ6623445.1 hypothetical protein [Streptomyces sp. DHE17-7]